MSQFKTVDTTPEEKLISLTWPPIYTPDFVAVISRVRKNAIAASVVTEGEQETASCETRSVVSGSARFWTEITRACYRVPANTNGGKELRNRAT